MISNAQKSTQPAKVSLTIKILGVAESIEFASISDAADHAISLISSGKAIPKSVNLGAEVVMTESDINLYWEQSRSSYVGT